GDLQAVGRSSSGYTSGAILHGRGARTASGPLLRGVECPAYNGSVRTLILAAGRFGASAAEQVARGRGPRLDVLELQSALGADLLDYRQVEASSLLAVRAARAVSASAGLAALGAGMCDRYDAVLTTGEDIGIPLATLLAGRRRRPAHTMIAHTMRPWKKRLFVRLLGAARRIDRILCYATSEEEHLTRDL